MGGKNPSTEGSHLEPRGELIAQYRPPMSFRYKSHWEPATNNSYYILVVIEILTLERVKREYMRNVFSVCAEMYSLMNNVSADIDLFVICLCLLIICL